MIKFEKISLFQWIDDAAKLYYEKDADELSEDELRLICAVYRNIKLPIRATTSSAGYDFFVPCHVSISKTPVLIPTGIRFVTDEPNVVLQLYPRSGLGFKYGSYLCNTVGIIDSDYYFAENQGHIFIKLTNCGDKPLTVEQGNAFAQGVFVEYGITIDDDATEERTGGFGSTDKK